VTKSAKGRTSGRRLHDGLATRLEQTAHHLRTDPRVSPVVGHFDAEHSAHSAANIGAFHSSGPISVPHQPQLVEQVVLDQRARGLGAAEDDDLPRRAPAAAS